MPPPSLKPELMVGDMIKTFLAAGGYSNSYPASYSDMTHCFIGFLTKYEVKLRTLPIRREDLYLEPEER